MKSIVLLIYEFFRLLLKPKQSLVLENILLRQQLNIYKRNNKKPKIKNSDRIILVWLSKIFSNWQSALVIVKPETVMGWHKKGSSYIGNGNHAKLAGLISTGNL